MGKLPFNSIIEKDSYYELILTNRAGTKIGVAKVDKDDLELVRNCGRWSLDKDGYVIRTNPRLAMHRLIMDAKEDELVDHKKTGIKFRSDNRRKNLRVCTHSQNCINKNIHPSNTSGHKGVSWDAVRKRWYAKITCNGKQKNLGRYETIEEAIEVYREAAKILHKDFQHAA